MSSPLRVSLLGVAIRPARIARPPHRQVVPCRGARARLLGPHSVVLVRKERLLVPQSVDVEQEPAARTQCAVVPLREPVRDPPLLVSRSRCPGCCGDQSAAVARHRRGTRSRKPNPWTLGHPALLSGEQSPRVGGLRLRHEQDVGPSVLALRVGALQPPVAGQAHRDPQGARRYLAPSCRSGCSSARSRSRCASVSGGNPSTSALM
jgi:hypothetical protein